MTRERHSRVFGTNSRTCGLALNRGRERALLTRIRRELRVVDECRGNTNSEFTNETDVLSETKSDERRVVVDAS